MPWCVSQWTWQSLFRIIRGGEELRQFSITLWLDSSFLYGNLLYPECNFPALLTLSFREFIILLDESKPIHILLGYFHFFSSSGQEKAEEGDRSWQAHPSCSEEGCTYGKGTATWATFNRLASPLPQLLSHNRPVCGTWASWKCKGEGEKDIHTLCQHL